MRIGAPWFFALCALRIADTQGRAGGAGHGAKVVRLHFLRQKCAFLHRLQHQVRAAVVGGAQCAGHVGPGFNGARAAQPVSFCLSSYSARHSRMLLAGIQWQRGVQAGKNCFAASYILVMLIG